MRDDGVTPYRSPPRLDPQKDDRPRYKRRKEELRLLSKHAGLSIRSFMLARSEVIARAQRDNVNPLPYLQRDNLLNQSERRKLGLPELADADEQKGVRPRVLEEKRGQVERETQTTICPTRNEARTQGAQNFRR